MVNAGEFVDAADINALASYYALKPADESLTSNAVLQNDDDLNADLSIGTWLLEAHLFHSGPAAGDVQTAWTTTGTIAALSRGIMGPSAGATDVTGAGALPRMQQASSLTLTANIRWGTDGTNIGYSVERLILDVSVAGTIQLQWAQFSSTGTATSMRTGSHLVWRRITSG